MIAQNGTTVMPDDYGNDRATAYPLGTATVGGLITTRPTATSSPSPSAAAARCPRR